MKLFPRLSAALAIACAVGVGAGAAAAQDFAFGNFKEQTGESLWQGICQGCHMPNAQGAVGAGAYPKLAGDPLLASNIYPVMMVLNGHKAMPAFGANLSDAQVAEVVNYLRTHFGNKYNDPVTPAQVKALRGGP
ncbi:MAG: cytochrome c [Caulobacteraceae bacterium]|nr:cytochrome c [Caulobacteraceae bacterium]